MSILVHLIWAESVGLLSWYRSPPNKYRPYRDSTGYRRSSTDRTETVEVEINNLPNTEYKNLALESGKVYNQKYFTQRVQIQKSTREMTRE